MEISYDNFQLVKLFGFLLLSIIVFLLIYYRKDRKMKHPRLMLLSISLIILLYGMFSLSCKVVTYSTSASVENGKVTEYHLRGTEMMEEKLITFGPVKVIRYYGFGAKVVRTVYGTTVYLPATVDYNEK